MNSSMNYAQLIQKLFSINLFGGSKLGLQNPRTLDAACGFPSTQFSSVHVAGTNGKGSVTKKMAAALEHAGYRVGCYTSPHISCFRERICINGNMISEEDVRHFLSHIFDVVETKQIPATFFEIATLLAFSWFAANKVDWAVIETGLGGRLDATNIIVPKVSVITSITLEHTDRLGNTLEEIAWEKAGIIKPGVPVVLGTRLPLDVFKKVAQANNSPLDLVEKHFQTYEEENCAIAERALQVIHVPPLSIKEGLKARLPCRMEVLTIGKQTVVLDVAHNPDGLTQLFCALRQQFKKPFRVVFGLSKTKDIEGCLRILKEQAVYFHPVEAHNGRGVSAKELQAKLLALGIPETNISMHNSVEDSIKDVLSRGGKELLVVCGTFFIMGDVRKALGIMEPCDPIDMNERQ